MRKTNQNRFPNGFPKGSLAGNPASVAAPHGLVPLERDEQRWLGQVLDALGVAWAHPVNEGKRSLAGGAQLKRQGMRAGLPDVLVFTSPPSRPEARGVALELKRRRGGKVSAHQSEWLARLEACGWVVRVCEGLDAAIAFLAELGWAAGGRR